MQLLQMPTEYSQSQSMIGPDAAPFDDVTGDHRWIDAALSQQLAELAESGDRGIAEFKRGLQEQASSLAK